MSGRQRLTFLAIAAVIAIVAVVVLAGSGDEGPTDSGEQAAATATPSATAEPQEASPQETATPEPTPLLRAGKVTKLKATEGETVRFRVRSGTDEEIHVHAYDITREIPAGKTVDVAFEADITGVVAIEFHGSGEQIAELTVEPS